MLKILRAISVLAALFAVVHHAKAATAPRPHHNAGLNCGFPTPDPGCSSTATPPVNPRKDPIAIGTAIYNDLVVSQTMAGPATTPIDPVGYACYTRAVNSMAGFSSVSPDGLISKAEAIYLLFNTVSTLAADQNCQAVCGRAQLLAAKVGGLLGGLIVPNVCGVFTSLAE